MVKSSIKLEVRDYLNSIRAIHGLAPVTYNFSNDLKTQSAALMIVQNGGPSHNPPSNWICYTPGGAEASSKSNLGNSGTDVATPTPHPKGPAIDNSLAETGAAAEHRIWLLNPWLRSFTLGYSEERVIDPGLASYGDVIWLSNPGDLSTPINTTAEFVAYPYGNYPSSAFNPGQSNFSFSVIADKTHASGNGHAVVDLDAATLTMTPSSAQVANLEIHYDSSVYNSLVWTADGVVKGTTYTVNVNNVKVKVNGNWITKNYTYTFNVAP